MATIRLNKQTKTIKVVNRKDNIRLKKEEKEVRLQHTGRVGPSSTVEVGSTTTLAPGSDAEVTNSGSNTQAVFNFYIPRGDKGDTGDTGVSTFVRVHHGTDPSIIRPNAVFVEWVGSVAPSYATVEDTWVDVIN